MTSKEFIRKCAYWSSFEDCAKLFSRSNHEFVFRSQSFFTDSNGDCNKLILYSYFPDVDIYSCEDSQLNYLIIEKYTRSDFNRDMCFFRDFYMKCNSILRDKLSSKFPNIVDFMNHYFNPLPF